MKKIIMSLSIIAAVGAVVIGGTTAYYSDVETSTGNTFTAGAVDLVISNEAHYSYDQSAADQLNWDLGDINDDGQTVTSPFINFTDVKPGDWGYNVMKAKVINNDAWGRFVVTKTLDSDVDCTGPEMKSADPHCGGVNHTPSLTNGELDNNIFMMAWDDTNGNGVRDNSEEVFLASNSNQATGWSSNNPFNPLISPNGVLVGNHEYEVTMGWCIGIPDNITPDQSGALNTAELNSNPTTDVDFSTCDGSVVDNRSQSDSLVADVVFEVEQTRNNPIPSWGPTPSYYNGN